ncbi:polysaccharide pyruvyl transferase family protein [Telluria aromaticivorans]|uniref:Polysaccharide pyruvyl transferase family protein n=1 Tax=Telluria aromaticivorans TaxID=2725995 RepID=A0A7Y2K2H7_9BURK|nr:polysaccharide pyruvyl transferase family protein [Telluria aromaticivorans]NNG24214.1 polysaccharide pyruvyl transferase family protein [Telluria aromaticivorans]
MKLFYYKDPIGNFGDDLNSLIWYNLAPELFDNDDSEVLVGIGTLINSRAPVMPTKYVFGSGVGYHQFPKIDDKWQFYCVRGPLSAQRLGIDPSLAITDPAVLLTQVLPNRPVRPTGMVSFMPHHASSRFADWKALCEKAGINYIDPAYDINETIFQLRQSRLVIAEAMHAAIVADALRVPWIPVTCYDHILDFKWNDWCQSLNMSYSPHTIASIYDMERNFTATEKIKTSVKRGLRKRGIWTENWTPPVPETNRFEMEDKVVAALSNLAQQASSCLSDEGKHFESIERLMEKLDVVRRDVARRSGGVYPRIAV